MSEGAHRKTMGSMGVGSTAVAMGTNARAQAEVAQRGGRP